MKFFGIIAALMFLLIGVQKYWLGTADAPLAAYGAGDGAFLRIGAMALIISLFLWVFVRRNRGGATLGSGWVLPEGTMLPAFNLRLPWSLRRIVVVLRRSGQDLMKLNGHNEALSSFIGPLLREGGTSLGWWLVVLAVILAVLGAQA
ncbi:hypothetical protein AA106555_0179 [Neokomagataea thailandica NBRC 106555]|nr:hypothetical protein AA106555_0179 [Neokomagataea thailandica NBRC 106555]